MRVTLGSISKKRAGGASPFAKAVEDYLARIQPWAAIESRRFPDEQSLMEHALHTARRPRPLLCLLDSRGRLVSSEEIAELIQRAQNSAAQHLICAIGGADGWTPSALAGADHVLSLGRITLPHELARLVMAEQIYRAFTILHRHPYHTGH